MASIREAIEDLLANPLLDAETAIARHFHPSFRQRVNGQWIDLASFTAAIVSLRQIVAGVTVNVLDEFDDGGRYAERHVIDILKHDGGRIRQEVYLFAQRSQDGRFLRIEEATLAV